MVKTLNIEYTETFDNTVDNLINHLASYSNEYLVIEKIENLIEDFEKRITTAPLSCPISPYLLELGTTSFREYNHNGFRLLYRVIEDEDSLKIQGDVLLSQKQSIEQVLIEYCLIYK